MTEMIIQKTNSGKLIPIQEIVRCRDCKYSPSNGAMTELLPSYLPCKSVPRMEDYFCADGEKKESV